MYVAHFSNIDKLLSWMESKLYMFHVGIWEWGSFRKDSKKKQQHFCQLLGLSRLLYWHTLPRSHIMVAISHASSIWWGHHPIEQKWEMRVKWSTRCINEWLTLIVAWYQLFLIITFQWSIEVLKWQRPSYHFEPAFTPLSSKWDLPCFAHISICCSLCANRSNDSRVVVPWHRGHVKPGR